MTEQQASEMLILLQEFSNKMDLQASQISEFSANIYILLGFLSGLIISSLFWNIYKEAH